ncbi:MAG TPA: PAS domain-containing protein, partial [Candidatus Saccharimonadales bacterium]|nr:PAS domain-containing protein [Candidatus Saccharimonadales bacterium]
RGERAMPSRTDISPRAMRDFLPFVGLLEWTSRPNGGEEYFVRLAGGKIEEIFGSITGQFIDQTLPPEIATRWRLVLDEVRKNGTPLAVSSRVAFNNLRHMKQELFVAPLGEGGRETTIFGVLDIWPVI